MGSSRSSFARRPHTLSCVVRVPPATDSRWSQVGRNWGGGPPPQDGCGWCEEARGGLGSDRAWEEDRWSGTQLKVWVQKGWFRKRGVHHLIRACSAKRQGAH